MRSKGFLAGLAGGAVGAALIVFVLVLVFNFGEVTETVGTGTSQTRTVYVPGTQGKSPQEIYQTLSGGVVMVQSDFTSAGSDVFGQSLSGQALGTGFVVDENGYILTNAHVVEEQGQKATSLTIVFNKGGTKTQEITGELIGIDDGSDVAVLKVDPEKVKLQPLPLGNSDAVAVGEPVVAIGNPLGYDFSITAGIVSATGRTLDAPNGLKIPNGIQTDAAINPGNSGGPLIDSDGRVIGINEQIASQTGGNEGLGFAVPINTAMSSLKQLKGGGSVKYAWLGVSGETLTSDIANVLNMAPKQGVLVEDVAAGSPAAKAGIQGGDHVVTIQGQDYTVGGDVIVKVDSTEIAGFDDLITFLSHKKPGDVVALTLSRDGKTRTVDVTLGNRPNTQ